MKNMHNNERGGSALGTVIFLAVLGYAVFIGLQYIPQKIEDMSLNSILDSMHILQQQTPVGSVQAVEAMIDRLLSTNELGELRGNFKVQQDGQTFIVTVSREWKLNLIFQEKLMKYEKTLTLR
jgi:hypothetical protein